MSSNFWMYAGDTKTLQIAVVDDNGDPADLSGATIKWQATRSFGKTPDIEKTTSDDIAITNGVGGIFQVELEADDTEDLKGNFYHEAEVTFSDSSISTVVSGTMMVQPVIIRAA